MRVPQTSQLKKSTSPQLEWSMRTATRNRPPFYIYREKSTTKLREELPTLLKMQEPTCSRPLVERRLYTTTREESPTTITDCPPQTREEPPQQNERCLLLQLERSSSHKLRAGCTPGTSLEPPATTRNEHPPKLEEPTTTTRDKVPTNQRGSSHSHRNERNPTPQLEGRTPL